MGYIRRLLNRVFGWEYVIYTDWSGYRTLKRVYEDGDGMYIKSSASKIYLKNMKAESVLFLK